jgi:hypothetical protein
VNDWDMLGLVWGGGPFYNHWLGKTGTPMTVKFSAFDDGWGAFSFAGFGAATLGVCSSKKDKAINLTLTHQTGYRRAGRVTVRLKGKITCKPGSWEFEGKISIDSEPYDFDWKKKGRSKSGKVATFLGGLPSGKNYTIHFSGDRKITRSGKCK